MTAVVTSRGRRSGTPWFRYAVLIVGAVVTCVPFLMMVSTSFKKQTFVLEVPPKLIPHDPTLANYQQAWSSTGFATYFLNSVLVAVSTVAGVLLIGAMMAYAFARFEFPGKRPIFLMLVATLMIPGMMLIIPQYLVAKDLHVLDSRLGLVLFYVAGQLAFTTFLLRGFIVTIPRDLDEAMLIDGAGRFRIFWSLILPLCRPALATAGIFSFLGAWDEFVWAVTVIDSPEKRTLPIAIALFQGQHATSWGLVFAASVIAVVPVITVFIIFQRQFVAGVQAGALKG
ncbi:carbohydrate ABC transporter permease [Nostocoides sp. HKS02]|uniref:carbohydrate ABC transporter permease n=1 Tax=Nostocoides sp. HKS02 TaxID=1813880 RepID=UPI0012B4B0F4|nr:carbohydrate ABC transporter permease [Tetrasphaera sp. HKS02]QGN59107.1 ABC transporter permease subunit [Tetrasphaera sp. HKS02]